MVAVIAALISANIGLMMMRERRANESNVPLATATQPAPTASPSTRSTTRSYSTRLGVFKGTRSEVASFENWLGREVKDVVHFSSRDTWGQITDPDLSEWRGSGYRLIYAVPMLPGDENDTKESSMRAGARGEYNARFATLARNLVAAGQESTWWIDYDF